MTAERSEPTPTTPLTTLRPGSGGRLRSHAGLDADDAALLSAMGLRRASRLRLHRAGEPCIVSVLCGCGGSCRIGLSKRLAERILVEPEGQAARAGGASA